MNYAEFAEKEDERQNKLRLEAVHRGNEAYNKGLKEGLGFFNQHLYPLFKRPIK